MAEAENVRLLTQVEELQGQVKKEGEVVPSETVPSASEKNVEARQEQAHVEQQNEISEILKQANEEIAALKEKEEQMSVEAEDNSNAIIHLTQQLVLKDAKIHELQDIIDKYDKGSNNIVDKKSNDEFPQAKSPEKQIQEIQTEGRGQEMQLKVPEGQVDAIG